jgi:hypothetical protein
LCGNTGAKPGYFKLSPGESVAFSVRWDVFSKHPVKRLGIRVYHDSSDRKKNEILWSGTIRDGG